MIPLSLMVQSNVSSASTQLRYTSPPTISRVFPPSGPMTGGTRLTIYGENMKMDSDLKVTLGGVPCTHLSFSDDESGPDSVECTTGPSEHYGRQSIVVTTQDGESVPYRGFKYLLPTPSVKTLSPLEGPLTGGTELTIQGDHFLPGMIVVIGDSSCSSVQWIDEHTLKCKTQGSGLVRTAFVRLRHIDGQEITSSQKFNYLPRLSVTRIHPSRGPLKGDSKVRILGRGFASESQVSLGGVACNEVSVDSQHTEMTCTTGAIPEPQLADLVVTHPVQGTFHLPKAFQYVENPYIIGIEPNLGSTDTWVVIQGANFHTRNLSVTIGGVPCQIDNAEEQITKSSILCTLGETNQLGPAEIQITFGDGTVSRMADGFTFFEEQEIRQIAPPHGPTQGDTLVLIRGSGFPPNSQVYIGDSICGYPVVNSRRIACFTGPGTEGLSSIKIIGPNGERIEQANAYTYQTPTLNVPQPPSLHQLRPDNHFGGTYPSSPSELEQITDSISHRLLKGAHYYGRYGLPLVTNGLMINVPISPFSLVNLIDVEQAKRDYLSQPENQAVPFDQILTYFDELFPQGQPLPPDHPYFLSPKALVLFHEVGVDGLPERISEDDHAAVLTARRNISNALGYAKLGQGLFGDSGDIEKGWVLDLRYNLKRVLNHLKLSSNPDELRLAIQILASVGDVCGVGNSEGIQLIGRTFFRDAGQTLKEPVTLVEHIQARLDLLREEIFNLTASFANDTQTAHTKNYYRKLVSSELALAPGFEDPFASVAHHPIDTRTFIRRFFLGKLGQDDSDSRELQRSHKGYSPSEITRTVIDLLKLNEATPVFVEELKALLTQDLSEQEIRTWAMKSENAQPLVAQALLLDLDAISAEEAQEAIQSYSTESLRAEFAYKEYFTLISNETGIKKPFLNEKGLSQLLLKTGVLKKRQSH